VNVLIIGRLTESPCCLQIGERGTLKFFYLGDMRKAKVKIRLEMLVCS